MAPPAQLATPLPWYEHFGKEHGVRVLAPVRQEVRRIDLVAYMEELNQEAARLSEAAAALLAEAEAIKVRLEGPSDA